MFTLFLPCFTSSFICFFLYSFFYFYSSIYSTLLFSSLIFNVSFVYFLIYIFLSFFRLILHIWFFFTLAFIKGMWISFIYYHYYYFLIFFFTFIESNLCSYPVSNLVFVTRKKTRFESPFCLCFLNSQMTDRQLKWIVQLQIELLNLKGDNFN